MLVAGALYLVRRRVRYGSNGKDVIDLVAVGDIALAGRDYNLSFAKFANIIKSADIAFYNNEGPYADKGPYISRSV